MQSDPPVRPIGFGLAPFAAAAGLAWLAVPIGSSVDWVQYAVSVLLLGLSGAMAVARVAGRHGWGLGIVADAYVFLAAVAVLRNSAGGISSAVGILSLIPVFHTALYSRSRRDLYLVLAGVAVVYLAPILVFGAPHYPGSQYRATLLTVMIGSIIGLATQRLVDGVGREAGEAETRLRMLEQVSTTVRGLRQRPHARADLCQAAQTISDASAAILFEPFPDTGALRSTAMCGRVAPEIEIAPEHASALNHAFVSGHPHLITENVEESAASHVLWTASGQPESMLYQPLLRAGEPVGVLVVGWRGATVVDRPRALAIELLAHEAAMVIDRADAGRRPEDMPRTDRSNGQPNRRVCGYLTV
jgi:K+-sensing histidine kinase KdpD